MSEQIDWSKAPEWAKWHGLAGEMKSQVWFDDEKYSYVDGQQDGKAFFYCDACTYSSQDFSNVTFRPTTPSWSVEGLPPVGVVCGKCYNSPGEYYNVRVLAHDSHYGEVVIYRWIEGPLEGELDQSTMHLNMASGSNAHWSFRPIRTPEQIAADEREKAIQGMVSVLPLSILSPSDACGLLYDAGFRKP